jgi:hypothetical protein
MQRNRGTRLPARFNAAGVYHIHVELDHAIFLCDAAKAVDAKTTDAQLARASSLYCRALKLIPRVHLSVREAQEINQKCERLIATFREFGSALPTALPDGIYPCELDLGARSATYPQRISCRPPRARYVPGDPREL